MNLRIAKAQEMLKTTELSALDVALACGFNDSTYFSRAFRKIAGATPTQYRKVSRLVLGNRAKDGQDS